MSAEQTKGWTVNKAASLPSTYLFSYLNKTRAAAASSPQGCAARAELQSHYPDILASVVQRTSSGAETRTCSFKTETLTSSRCAIIDISDRRAERRGLDFYSRAAGAFCAEWKRRDDSDVGWWDAVKWIRFDRWVDLNLSWAFRCSSVASALRSSKTFCGINS